MPNEWLKQAKESIESLHSCYPNQVDWYQAELIVIQKHIRDRLTLLQEWERLTKNTFMLKLRLLYVAAFQLTNSSLSALDETEKQEWLNLAQFVVERYNLLGWK